MNARLIIILTVTAIAAASYLLFTEQARKIDNEKLFPNLTLENLNQIYRIEISSGDEQIEIARDEQNVWRLPAEEDYPASAVRIRGLLTVLSELEKLEPKTSVAENYNRIGVQDPTEETSNALLTFYLPDGKYELIIGNSDPKLSKGQYVRILNDDQSWLVNRRILAEVDSEEWLDKEILHIEEPDIESIEITDPNTGHILNVGREAKDKPLKLQTDLELIEDKVNLGEFAVRRLASVLEYMKFKALVAELPVPAEEYQAIGKYKTYGGLEITVTAYEDEDRKELFVIAADADPSAEPEQKARAEQIKEITEGRVYEVPNVAYQSLVNGTDSLGQLLKE